MEKASYDYYKDICESLEYGNIQPDTYISTYLNSGDILITQMALEPHRFNSHLKNILPPQERLNIISPFLEHHEPMIYEQALALTISTFEKELDIWELYFENLAQFTTHPDPNFRKIAYILIDTPSVNDKSLASTYNKIPKEIHLKIINLIDNTLNKDNDNDVKVGAASLFVNYINKDFFDNPIEEIHKRLAYDNTDDIDLTLISPLRFKLREMYSDDVLFKEFSRYRNENILASVCEFFVFSAKNYLLSNKKAQDFMFDLLQSEEISERTYQFLTFLACKRFNSLNKDFCIAIVSRLEDENPYVRGEAMYTYNLIIEDAKFRKMHPK